MGEFDKWHEKARKEFKGSNVYAKYVGEDFSVTPDGNVHLDDGQVLEGAVTKFTD